MKVVVGPVVVSVTETLPEVGRTGATGATIRLVDDVEAELIEVTLDAIEVEAAVETITETEVLDVVVEVDDGEAVTVGLTVMTTVEPASHPTPTQL